MASYRYRAQIPSQQLMCPLNTWDADTIVIAKPESWHPKLLRGRIHQGKVTIVDFCDDHFQTHPFYQELLKQADAVTCSTENMQQRIHHLGREATVIPDPYEYPEVEPHTKGSQLLWYGHRSNLPSLFRVEKTLRAYPLLAVSNAEGMRQWSYEVMLEEFARADMVIMPHTQAYKSPNRTVEAVRQGCFVVAEPHPALNAFEGIYVGDILKGIQWAIKNPGEARIWTKRAQKYVRDHHSPIVQADAWKSLFEQEKWPLMSAVAV